MTDYGREPGNPAWHPDDPLFGDPGWPGDQPEAYQGEGDPDPSRYPRQVQGHQQYAQYGGQPQQYPHQQYPHQQYPHQQYPHQQYPQYEQYQQYEHHGPYPQYGPYGEDGDPGHAPPQGYAPGPMGYDDRQPYEPLLDYGPTAPYTQQAPPPAGHPDPYGHGDFGGYGGYGQGGPDMYGGYPDQAPDPYGRVEWPAEPGRPGPEAFRGVESTAPYGLPAVDPAAGRSFAPDAVPETGWDPGPDRGEHAFFAGDDDPDDDSGDERRSGREERRGGRTRRGTGKRRNGCACLFVSFVLVGVVGTGGYFGYDFYRTRIAPPDYAGKGTGHTQVSIPGGASLKDMGGVLEKAGVVRSSAAFVKAAGDNSRSGRIQPGTYSLRGHMSGAAAVGLMLSPASQNVLIVPEGVRATTIYKLVDKRLAVTPGTTEKAAHSSELGLPSWAKGKPEGLLYPSRYSVGRHSKPADVLREMVKRGEAEHVQADLKRKAKQRGRSPEEIITIASLIQAEAQEDEEFGKVSRVIYNRLHERMRLGFDSTINYAKGRSSLDTSTQDTRYASPYNTYLHHGLPPGPIDSPGRQAIEAALNPTKGNWLYFVTVKPGDTRFTDSRAQHDRNVQDFNNEQRRRKESGG